MTLKKHSMAKSLTWGECRDHTLRTLDTWRHGGGRDSAILYSGYFNEYQGEGFPVHRITKPLITELCVQLEEDKGLKNSTINRFLSALDRVLKVEKETIRKFDTVNHSKLELILNPFIKKDTVSEIDQAITNFESYYLLEEADADEALEYFINLEVSNFSNEHSRQQGLEENEPPF